MLHICWHFPRHTTHSFSFIHLFLYTVSWSSWPIWWICCTVYFEHVCVPAIAGNGEYVESVNFNCGAVFCDEFFKLFWEFQHDESASVIGMIMPITVIACFIELLFFYTYFGQILHLGVSHFGGSIYESECYRYPVRVQRFVLMMMMQAQRPFYISAYGIMRCNLELFVGVKTQGEEEEEWICIGQVYCYIVWWAISIEFQAVKMIYTAFRVMRDFEWNWKTTDMARYWIVLNLVSWKNIKNLKCRTIRLNELVVRFTTIQTYQNSRMIPIILVSFDWFVQGFWFDICAM